MGLNSLETTESLQPSANEIIAGDDSFVGVGLQVARLIYEADAQGRFVFNLQSTTDGVIKRAKEFYEKKFMPLGLVLDSFGEKFDKHGAFYFENVISYIIEHKLDVPVYIVSLGGSVVAERVQALKELLPQLRIGFLLKGSAAHISFVADPIAAFARI